MQKKVYTWCKKTYNCSNKCTDVFFKGLSYGCFEIFPNFRIFVLAFFYLKTCQHWSSGNGLHGQQKRLQLLTMFLTHQSHAGHYKNKENLQMGSRSACAVAACLCTCLGI